jgi:nanoRNase/pAp phosphatase (c-di-AMP/oligoRNAs hydrolase)
MKQVLHALKNLKGKNILILTHHNADVDAIASAIALGEYLKAQNDVKIATCESIAKPAKRIAESFEILIDPDCSKFDFVIVLDTSSSLQLKTAKNLKVDMIIDHHEKGDLHAQIEWIDKEAKATSFMIYKILRGFGFQLTKKLAKILCAGIVADTAHLRLANREIFKALYELLDGVEFSEVLKLVAVEEEISNRIASLKAASRAELFKFKDLIVAISNLSSHEAIACRSLVKLGADIAIIIAKKDEEMRISSRARDKILDYGINLAEIFEKIGKFIEGQGGGHDLAGSANGKVKPLKDVKRFILREFVKKLGKYKKL